MTEQFNLGAGVSRSEKNLTGAAHSAANPESHKYERVP